MFGPIMRFNMHATKLHIEMAPLSRDVMAEFIRDGAMQSYEVLKFLGRNSAPVLEDEYDWFEKTRVSNDDVIWGIYVIDGEIKTLIGTTGLHDINGQIFSPCRSATSGFMIFRHEFWGRGIAGGCHRARTLYAFDTLGLVCIRSRVLFENTASRRAVESVGYVVNHTDRMGGLYKGEPRQDYALLCVNPDKYVWQYWWRTNTPEQKWLDGRKKATTALKWARKHVQYV